MRFSWMFSGRRQGSADGKLEGGDGVIRGAEGVDVLSLRIEQCAFRVEQIECGRAAQAVADRGYSIVLARRGEGVVADEDRLAQGRRGVCAGALPVQAHRF